MNASKKVSLVIASIVSLSEIVIVYELWYSGTWLLAPNVSWISWLKTGSFMLLFIGSLIAEMQPLSDKTHRLLLGAVLLLGLYQFCVNVVVNYTDAKLPVGASDFFTGWLTALQVKFAYATFDAFVRSAVVVIMWLVTGLVWRGVAVVVTDAMAELKNANEALQSTIAELQQRNTELSADNERGATWGTLSQAKRTLAINLLDVGGHLNGDRAAVMAAAKEEFGADKMSRSRAAAVAELGADTVSRGKRGKR